MPQGTVWIWCQSLRARAWAQLGYQGATGLLFALGVVFRSNRYWLDPLGLWADEASWVRRLFKHTLTNFDFRPLGYMDVTQLVVHIYCDERTLRILSYVAGLASLIIAFDIGRHLFRSRAARLLCLAAVALHPLLIDMSREFKPYSVEFCAHLGLICLFLRWRAGGALGWFYALLVCSVFTFLFAYNIVFLLPAIFALLGVAFLNNRAYRSLLATVLAALAALMLIVGVYLVALRHVGASNESEKFWGDKYHVFYLANGSTLGPVQQSRASWLAHKYVGLVEFPNVQRDTWDFPKSVSPAVSAGFVALDYYAWLTLHAVGLVALFFRHRRQVLVLLTLPLIVIMGFNWFGVWPFGVFRANTFLLAYYILIPMLGLDALILWTRRLGSVVAVVSCLLFLVPNLSVGFDWHSYKHLFTGRSEVRTVLRRLKQLRERAPAAARAEKSHVLLDMYSCSPFEFYLGYDDGTRREFGNYLTDNFDFDCTQSPRGTQVFMRKLRGKSFFVVVTDDRVLAATRAVVHKGATVLDEERVREAHDLYYATGH